jgi:hypothetical protein
MGRTARALLTTFVLVVVARVVRGWQRTPAPAGDGVAHWPPLTPTPVDAAPAVERADPEPRAWMPPLPDGAAPPGYPVKAKRSSGIYHVPGGLAYERTFPDRCYPYPAAAEADGYRAAKR